MSGLCFLDQIFKVHCLNHTFSLKNFCTLKTKQKQKNVCTLKETVKSNQPMEWEKLFANNI